MFCGLADWSWSTIGALASIGGIAATLFIGIYIGYYLRFKNLGKPGESSFIIPSSWHHSCDFARQNEHEHRVKSVTLPANGEWIVDFVIEPFRSFNSAQIAIEFTGRLEEKPYAIELLNRFVEVGSRRHVVPGQVGNDDYIDKHKLYHCIENMSWPKGLTKLMDSK
jgi:hypothetical protein